MLQRNVSGSPLNVSEPPAQVPPGGVIDHPNVLAGFELVEVEPVSAVKPSKPTSRVDDTKEVAK